MSDVNRQKANPDPAVINARKKYYTQSVTAAKPKAVVGKPSMKVMDAKELNVEVLEEKPIELKLETLTVAIQVYQLKLEKRTEIVGSFFYVINCYKNAIFIKEISQTFRIPK